MKWVTKRELNDAEHEFIEAKWVEDGLRKKFSSYHQPLGNELEQAERHKMIMHNAYLVIKYKAERQWLTSEWRPRLNVNTVSTPWGGF